MLCSIPVSSWLGSEIAHREAIRVAGYSMGMMVVVTAGLPIGFHFHDLRHTGNQLAANSGATTRELMHRMGHGLMRAALISTSTPRPTGIGASRKH